MAPRPPDPVARLRATPPQRFTAARAEVARALEDAGDPSAGAVRKLRRPTGLAWVMNRLALDRRDDVDALVAAGDRVRAGQRRALAGGGAEAMRGAEAELRDGARALRLAGAEVLEEEGRPASQAALARLELLLRAVATAPGPARDAFREARLEREPEIAPGDLSGFAIVAGSAGQRAPPEPDRPARRAGPAEPSRSAERPAAARDAHARADARAAAAAAREERDRADREARDRARAREAAAASLARARASERKAGAAARTAEAAATRAAAAAARAADRARALRARAEEARAEAERREAALAALGPDRA